MKSKKTILYFVILVIGVIILLNLLANRFFFRLDLTQDNRYTLSTATRDILRNLEEPVTITAYFSKNLGPDYDIVRRNFKDLLVEYANLSKGMLAYEFVDPLESEELENEIMQEGIMQLQIQMREKDEIKVQKAYMGAVIHLGENTEVLPTIESGIGMEYNLTTAIKKLSVVDKPVIGILQGHGEPPLSQLQQVVYDLQVLYNVEPVTLSDSTLELEKYQTIAIISPTDSISDNDLAQLDAFIARGGRIFVGINRVDANLNQNLMGFAVNTGLETWLAEKGIIVNENFVVDENCVPVGVQRQQGPFVVTQQIPFHYFPVVNTFSDHPISSSLEQVLFQFASSINFSGDSTVVFTPLLKTSDNSGTQPASTFFDLNKQWSKTDFPLSGLTVAATVEGPIAGNIPTKMVIVGDGNFPIGGGQQGQINPDNASLLVNSIDWLSDDTGLIELRTKGATSRPLDDIEEGKRAFLKYLNFLLPIFLVIIYGIFRMQHRQNLRIKRMEAGYVK